MLNPCHVRTTRLQPGWEANSQGARRWTGRHHQRLYRAERRPQLLADHLRPAQGQGTAPTSNLVVYVVVALLAVVAVVVVVALPWHCCLITVGAHLFLVVWQIVMVLILTPPFFLLRRTQVVLTADEMDLIQRIKRGEFVSDVGAIDPYEVGGRFIICVCACCCRRDVGTVTSTALLSPLATFLRSTRILLGLDRLL